jgi:hypothetical protein
VKRIGVFASIMFFGLMTMSDSSATPILCKQQTGGFTCPIIVNMSADGSSYDYVNNATDGTWNVKGPWGSGGIPITVYGNSRCSGTSGTYPNIGNPISGGGEYCWCQMINGLLSGVWVFLTKQRPGLACALFCADYCAYHVQSISVFGNIFLSTLCERSCDDTTVIAENNCSLGYIKCIGSKTSSNTAGNYTITCNE